MKRNDANALHSKTKEELVIMSRDLEEEIAKLIKEKQEKKIKNTSLIRFKKDDLARVKTELRLKHL